MLPIASRHTTEQTSQRLKLLQGSLGVPHSEETLAMLVNVHIVGGSKDLALHLQGLTLRIPVMKEKLCATAVIQVMATTA